MDTQDLRSSIWDDLYRTRASRTIRELAAQHGSDVETVYAAVNHDWFRLTDDRVAIAMAPADNPNIL